MDPDEQPGEIEAGTWIPVTRNTWRHGQVVGNVYAALRAYSKAQGGWSVSVGDPGVRLQRGPDTLRGPDVAMVRKAREPQGKGADGWLEGAPYLAVEVAGDVQAISDLTRKALEYLRAGAQLVWVVDVQPQRVLVFTPPDHVRVVGAQETLDGAPVAPGLVCLVADFFES